MGFIRLALVDPEKRTLSQREIADKMREILEPTTIPGVEFLQWPGGLVASVFANGYIAPLVVEVRGDNLDELDAQAQRRRRGRAHGRRHSRHLRRRSQIDYPEVRVDTDREEAGLVGVTARDAAQTTLEATLGNINTPSVWIDPNNGQSYYVVTYYDGAARHRPERARAAPGAHRRRRQGRARSARTARSRRSVGPDRHRAQPARSAPRTCCMQTEGRDIGSAARRARAAAARATRARATSSSTSSARSS